jgi:quercetin dioxygenase-like cupin family protein
MGEFVLSGQWHEFVPGTVLLVPAEAVHRFENFSMDFSTWVVFWGSQGGA